jgi:glyoxylase I family protein
MTDRGAHLHHVALVVSDLDRTRAFYVDVLGFEEIRRPTDFVFHGAYFRLGDAEIHVVREKTPGRLRANAPHWELDELQTGLVHHVALMVDDLEPYLSALQARGLDRVGGFRVRDDFVEQVYVADPDGNVIELLRQHDPASGRARRQQIYDEGIAVPVAPGYPLVDPRETYGEA